MKNICLLFGLYPKEDEQFFYENCKTLQNAANALMWGYIEGLKQYEGEVTVLNMPMIPSYPDLSNIYRLKGYSFNISPNIKCTNLPYYNLVYYKYYSMYYHARKNLKKWYRQSQNNRTVVVYGQYSPWLNAAYSVKKKYGDLRIINIIPDVPQFLGFGKSLRYKILRNVNKRIVDKGIKCIDAYVLLSKYMTEVVPMNGKPWKVVEGIYNSNHKPKMPQSVPDVFSQGKKIVLYTGDLTDIYGVKDLVDAFHRLERTDSALVICGNGNSREYIKSLAETDHRIHYLGLVERDTVLYMQQNATLLVNPRNSEGEYTKYSFPSKTMEYLSSGTPVLMSKLPGVPDEYFTYCFATDIITEDILYTEMNRILSMDNEILSSKGEEARQFILEQKNPTMQCKKLIELINKL